MKAPNLLSMAKKRYLKRVAREFKREPKPKKHKPLAEREVKVLRAYPTAASELMERFNTR